MAFPQQTSRAFTKLDVLSLNPNQHGVYGIFNQFRWVYVGKGDIKERLLAHLNGDIPAILTAGATHWVGEACGKLAMDLREKQLIVECNPHCNQRIG